MRHISSAWASRNRSLYMTSGSGQFSSAATFDIFDVKIYYFLAVNHGKIKMNEEEKKKQHHANSNHWSGVVFIEFHYHQYNSLSNALFKVLFSYSKRIQIERSHHIGTMNFWLCCALTCEKHREIDHQNWICIQVFTSLRRVCIYKWLAIQYISEYQCVANGLLM